MYYPSLENIKKLSEKGNLIPVYREIEADLETPVSAYLKVARNPYSFLFESVEGGERLARYSFIGTEPYGTVTTGPTQLAGSIDPLTLIQDELNKYTLVPRNDLPRFHGGAVGYLSYEVAHYFEPRLQVPEHDELKVPEALFMLTDTLLIFDHLRREIKIVSHCKIRGSVENAYREAIDKIDTLVERLSTPLQQGSDEKRKVEPVQGSKLTSNFTRAEYLGMVNKAKQYVYEGDIIQVVPAQRFARPTSASPFSIYRSLRAINPSPYMYYLNLDGFQIIGASPEMLLRVEEGQLTTHPIAGTRPRGKNDGEEAQLERDLIDSEKEQAEHIMLVDLARNDLGRVSQTGTVKVNRLMGVDKFSHVMHLVSEIRGTLKADLNAFDAMRACFPAGTLSGAPKIRAMEIISELEGENRGPYGGCVGYFSFSGNSETAITIRTIVLKNGIAYAQAGGGIVADSVPEEEYQETLHKAGALFVALDRAEDR